MESTAQATVERRPEAPVADVDRDQRLGNLRRHTASGMLVNSAYQIGLVGVSALRALVVAAFLTRAQYGLWGIIGVTLWTALGFKGVFGAGDKYVQQSEDDQERAFQLAFTIQLIFAGALAPIAAGIVVAFAALTGQTAVLAPGFVLLLLLPSTALQFPVAVFYRRLDYRRQRTLQAIEPFVGAIVMIALAVLGAGYWSFVVGTLVGSWAGALVALRASPYRLAFRYDAGTLRSYTRFSFGLVITAFSMLAVFQVILIVGVHPLGLAGLGAFTLVGNLVQFTDQADGIVTETLYPAVCAVSERLDLQTEIFVKSNRLSLMWAVPFGVGMTLFGSDLLHFILGRHWLPALPLLQILGLVTAVNHVGYNWSAFLKSRGTTWPIAASAVIVSGVLIGAGVPLMYSDGLVGLGYAFAIAAVVSLILRGYFIARFFNGVRLLTHLGRAFAPTLFAVAPVLGLRALLGSEPGLLEAAEVFALYVACTVAGTAVFERPLLGEAFGYLAPIRAASA